MSISTWTQLLLGLGAAVAAYVLLVALNDGDTNLMRAKFLDQFKEQPHAAPAPHKLPPARAQ